MARKPKTDSELPPELRELAVREAQADAVGVAALLKTVDIGPARLPARILLGLAVALRLCFWEMRGVTPFLPYEGPNGRELLLAVCRSATEPAGGPADLLVARAWNALLQARIHAMAWSGLLDLGADIVLRTPENKDLFWDVLAELIWAIRHPTGAA